MVNEIIRMHPGSNKSLRNRNKLNNAHKLADL